MILVLESFLRATEFGSSELPTGLTNEIPPGHAIHECLAHRVTRLSEGAMCGN